MPVTEFDLDPTTEERIVARAIDRGRRRHRRSTMLRRSVTVVVLLAVTAGGVAASHAGSTRQPGASSSPAVRPSTAGTTGAPTSTTGGTGGTGGTGTTGPGTTTVPGTTSPTTVPVTTTVPNPTTTAPVTTTVPNATTTTVPVTTQTTIPGLNQVTETLDATAAPGQDRGNSWTVPSSVARGQIVDFTFTGTGTAAASGQIVLSTSNPSSPSDLLDIGTAQLSSGPVTINFQAPVVLAGGESLDLDLVCDQASAATCGAIVTFDVAEATSEPNALYSSSFGGGIAPGSSGVAGSWTVPAGYTFHQNDTVLTAPPGEQGTVQVLVGKSPSSATTLYSGDLSQVSAALVVLDYQDVKEIGGEQLFVTVSCSDASPSPCAADVLFTGQLLPPL